MDNFELAARLDHGTHSITRGQIKMPFSHNTCCAVLSVVDSLFVQHLAVVLLHAEQPTIIHTEVDQPTIDDRT